MGISLADKAGDNVQALRKNHSICKVLAPSPAREAANCLDQEGCAYQLQDVPEEVLRELGSVSVQDCGEEAFEYGLPGCGQVPVLPTLADVLEDLGHHAVQLFCRLVKRLHETNPTLSKLADC